MWTKGLTAGLTAAILLTCAACQSDVDTRLSLAGLSSKCRINSDCSSLLVCVFELCHQECTTSRDCPNDARCVESEQRRNVCQLPEESDCSEGGRCQGSQVCGADGECRDACQSDAECISEQICSLGTCADAAELDSGGDLPRVEASTPLPPPCGLASDCPGSLVCVAGTCRAQCEADEDCEPGESCRGAICERAATEAACLRNSDCTEGQRCSSGRCEPVEVEPAPECDYDSECQTAGQHCLGGKCTCECVTSADCGDGYHCLDGCECVPGRVLQGDIHVSNEAELRSLDGVVEVTGLLLFSIDRYGHFHLPTLRKAANVEAAGNYAIITFDSLREVSGYFTCRQDCPTPQLETVGDYTLNSRAATKLHLPALETARDVNLWHSPALRSIDLPKLKSARALQIHSNAQLTELKAPVLSSLTHVGIVFNDVLTSLKLPVAAPTLSARVNNNPALETLSLPGVTNLSEALFLADQPKLATLDVSGLQTAQQITLQNLPNLTQLDLPAATSLGGLNLSNLAAATSFVAPALGTMGDLSIHTAPQLSSLQLGSLTSVGNLSIQTAPQLSSLQLGSLTSAGNLSIQNAQQLSSLQLGSLISAGNIYLYQTGVTELSRLDPALEGALASAGDLSFWDNPALPVCAIGSLAQSLRDAGWEGLLTYENNLECVCSGPVCQ